MTQRNLADISEKMREIDIAMLSTRSEGGAIAARPMSNNAEVDYDGDSYYFTWKASRMVADIRRDPQVALAFQGSAGFTVAVQGLAEIIEDRAAFEDHWTEGLDHWFEDGTRTKGLVMIKVSAERIHFWDGEEDGEITQ